MKNLASFNIYNSKRINKNTLKYEKNIILLFDIYFTKNEKIIHFKRKRLNKYS